MSADIFVKMALTFHVPFMCLTDANV